MKEDVLEICDETRLSAIYFFLRVLPCLRTCVQIWLFRITFRTADQSLPRCVRTAWFFNSLGSQRLL